MMNYIIFQIIIRVQENIVTTCKFVIKMNEKKMNEKKDWHLRLLCIRVRDILVRKCVYLIMVLIITRQSHYSLSNIQCLVFIHSDHLNHHV